MTYLKESEMRLLNKEQVMKMTGITNFDIDEVEYDYNFPQQISIRGQKLGWLESEVKEWMWVKAIERSWGSESRWEGVEYSILRLPTNMLGSNAEIFNQVQADMEMRLQSEGDVRVPISVNPADPFGDALEMDVVKI